MKTVIMSGGYGKRILSIDSTVPKPLINIAGKPILQWELECLVQQGFTDIILTVSHMSQKIMDYFGDGSSFGCSISYFNEAQPLGNAGALFKLWESEQIYDDFLLLNADSMFDVDFHRMISYHHCHEALATLFTHPNNHPSDSGLIISSDVSVVTKWLTREDERPQWYKNRVNAGVHVINTQLLEMSGIDPYEVGNSDSKRKVDLDRDILKPLVGTRRIYSYDSPEYVKDMGTPDRFEQVIRDLESGLVSRRNLSEKQRAIFLDRDGTINKYVGFLRNIDDFELLPGVSDAIKTINASGYLAILVTNQPVIARGEVTYEQLQEIHNKMETLLGADGAYLDAIYFCPHHPHQGYEGEVTELKIECECRKPKPGMLLKAAEEYNIDLSASWMIGDGENDIEAGIAAGCHTALIGSANCGQDATGNSLLEILSKIIT